MRLWRPRRDDPCGTEFDVIALRVTETDLDGELGNALVRGGSRRFRVQMTPVIEEGKTWESPPGEWPRQSYRGVDKFKYFEFGLKDLRRLWKRDKRLQVLLSEMCAVELWTRHVVGSDQDVTFPWVHWVFPCTTWRKTGYGRYVGRSHTGTEMTPDDFPETEPLTEGGFYKTAVPPPA